MDKIQAGMAVMTLAAAFLVSAEPAAASENFPLAATVSAHTGHRLPSPPPEDNSRSASTASSALLAGRRYELPEPPVKKIRLGRPQ